MADSKVPVLLNRGIDLVTPPLLAEAGTLLDSHNYEIAADVGYRRWDGYERRDGYPGGGFFTWNSITVGAVGYPFSNWQVGEQIYLETDYAAFEPIGVITAISTSPNRLNYVPYNNTNKLFTGKTISRWNGSAFDPYVVASDSVDGRTIVTDPLTYLSTTRNYQAILRGFVQDAPARIAGVFFSRDRSYEVLDCLTSENSLISSNAWIEGERVRYLGNEYIYAGRGSVNVFPGQRQNHFIPTGNTASPNTSDFVGIDTGTTMPMGSSVTMNGARYGYLVWLGYPDRNLGVVQPNARQRNFIRPAIHYTFNNGSYATSEPYPPSGTYYVTTSGGGTLVAQGIVNQFSASSGTWLAGNAQGRANFILTSTSPLRAHLIAGDEIHTAFPTGPGTRVMTLTANGTLAKLAGTAALREGNTFYQWGTFNFYASVGSEALFATNGVYRAMVGDWAGYSNIYTQEDALLDNPKYLTFHAGQQLGLGFAEGSFQISVGGVPWDFSGTRGALEVGTGDDITGLLESVNDSTLIFGKRSIRRVTGTTDTTLELGTVSANAGAYDYTCVNVGATPVFTGPTGVSTLEQSSNYGDFIGNRATADISTWLIPKLISNEGGIDPLGPRCAIPVRNKNQYRLFLNSGDVVTVTFTTEGPKTMKGSYKQPSQKPRVPFAWSSAIADNGDEHIEMVWDKEYARTIGTSAETLPEDDRAYRLDNGWGFDGEVFEHWFDVAYTYVNNGTDANRVSKVRAHGLGYGVASLDLKASGFEEDYDLSWSSRIQPINMPSTTKLLYSTMQPVAGIVDHQNWGFGVKIRINGTVNFSSGLGLTEPSHIIQVLVMYLDGPGAQDA